MLTTDIPPNPTLYCTNLNDKIKKPDLAANLYELFSPFGEVIAIENSRRATAFVTFREIGNATEALREKHGMQFLGKPIKIDYAKTKSDATAILDGTFKASKRRREAAAKGAAAPNATAAADGPAPVHVGRVWTLCVEGLPDNMTSEALKALFGQYPGFYEVRLVAGRNVAFIDFKTETEAEIAMKGLMGFLVTPTNKLQISWTPNS